MQHLSKSRIIEHRQCARRLWLRVHRPDLDTQASTSAQSRMQAGTHAGEVACSLFPGGRMIEAEKLSDAIALTTDLLNRKPKPTLFEATFSHRRVLVRVDILQPVRGGYDIVEVKSSTEIQGYHLEDAAIQTWVCQQAGLPIKRTQLAHINKTFVYPGKQQYDGLFAFADITKDTDALLKQVPHWTKAAFATLNEKSEPIIEPGEHCKEPFKCPYVKHCAHEYKAAKYPPEDLGNQGNTVNRLREQGYTDLRKVPKALLGNNKKHLRIWRACRSGKAELDPAAGEHLRSLAYPRYFLDFETIQFIVPTWKGTRPYQQIPFQWSCHKAGKNGTVSHTEFLDISGKDPSKPFLETLIPSLGKRGPIFVYSHFERDRLKALAIRFPKYAIDIEAILERMVDLLPLSRAHYYHPAMHGSWSIKAVLPTIAPELDYSALEGVQDGGEAQQAYLEAIHRQTTGERKTELQQAMLAYCKLDTEALVRLAEYFEGH